MALPDEGTAPYAPTYAITNVLTTYRDTGLGMPLKTSTLARLGITDSIAPRVMQTLKILDLIDEDGNASKNLLAFKQASHDSYQAVLADILRQVYAPIFAVTGADPSTRTPQQLEDAFRTYTPDSLRPRMVNLFLGLCQYAGIIHELPEKKPGPKARPPSPGNGGRKVTPRVTEGLPQPPPAAPPMPLATTSDVTGATLRSGGTVTLSVSVSVVDLSREDRDFVFDLIDKIKAYGQLPELGVGTPTPNASEGVPRVHTVGANAPS